MKIYKIIKLKNDTSSSTLSASNSTEDTKFEYPTDNGYNGYVLKTDGNGITSWTPMATVSRIQVNSSVYSITSPNAVYGVTYTTTGAATLTLPLASGYTGVIYIADEGGNAEANNITVNTSGGNTINGQTNLIINLNYMSVGLYSNGTTGWFIF